MQGDVLAILFFTALAVGATIAANSTVDIGTTGKNCCTVKCGGCDKKSWSQWSACSTSSTCGQGTRTRTYRYECRCLLRICTMKDCGRYTETGSCSTPCKNGGTVTGGTSPACSCQPAHYGNCCDKDCPSVEHCDSKHWGCNTGPPSYCKRCEQYADSSVTGSAYWPEDEKKCTPRCNWLGHWCWPGTCDTSNQYLASTCQCAAGFQKVTPNDETTKCELTERPKIETCRLGVEGANGETGNSTFLPGPTNCDNTRDTYIGFQPKEFFVAFDSHLPVDPPEEHNYVESSSFGIVEATVEQRYYELYGDVTLLTTLDMASQAVCNDNSFGREDPVSGLMSCTIVHPYNGPAVKEGSMLCHRFLPSASGYVKIKNIVDGSVSDKSMYAITKPASTTEKCFRFDFTSPFHCKANSPPCEEDPLIIGPRIQRHAHISALFQGYFDPPPPSSAVTAQSGLARYTLDVHAVLLAGDHLFVDHNIIETHTTTHEVTELDFELPQTGEPMMYCLVLTALDVAGNYRMARRFVIYDNTSFLALDKAHHSLRPLSANPATGYIWQNSHLPIVVDWNEYFYNVHYRDINFLLPIREDNRMTGIYEQLDVPLPVTGTPNVHGIVHFLYRYELTSPTRNKSVPFQPVSDMQAQQVSLKDLELSDGDTVDVTVMAIDVSNNTITDSFRVHIDASPPELAGLGLNKDGDRAFIRHSKNLAAASMNFTFEARDPHSGLKQVTWKLGSHPGGSDISSGTLPVVRSSEQQCKAEQRCYCPIVGDCSPLDYTIELKEALDDADHNQDYYFWIEVVNSAMLRTELVVKILVDESPSVDKAPANK